MVRFYEGLIFGVQMAVCPTKAGVSYCILHMHKKRGREAYIKCGFEREIRVNEHARFILKNGKKLKILKLPFVKEDGRLVCDLPMFLKQRGIRYKIYKRPGQDCMKNSWNDAAYNECICKNGEICWGSEYWSSDWGREYWLNITYNACFPIINEKKISGIAFWSLGKESESKETIEWFRKSMEEKMTMSWKEFGMVLDELGLPKKGGYITFCDGSWMQGSDVDWGDSQNM